MRALGLVVSVRVGLWVLPYRTVRKLVEVPLADVEVPPGEEMARLRRTVGAVEAMSRRLLKDKPCLTQALAAQRMLRQEGIDSKLRIGVAKDDGEFLAHAWLERGNRVLIGGRRSPGVFTPLEPLPNSATQAEAL